MNSNRSKDNKEVKRISLIPSRQEEPEYKYLPPIKHQQELADPKWQEFKIEGKNIEHRAYAAMTMHKDTLYLYGGYQVTTGIMADFYKMNLKAPSFQWEKIQLRENPGPRTRHALCTFGDRLMIFGGQIHQSISTNQMWQYDVNLRTWARLKQNSTYPPEIDNFGSVLTQDGWYVFGGFFGGSIGLHSNYVFRYDFNSNEWVHLQNTSGSAPAPRDGCGLTCYKESLYIFGGSNGHQRFNDLWRFEIPKKAFQYVAVHSNFLPRVRSGHSMHLFGDKIVVFGGIHDITWELDDLYCFNLQKMDWQVIEEDSARRKDNQGALLPPQEGSTRPSKQNFRKSVRKTTRSSSIRKTMKRPPVSPGREQQSEVSVDSPTRNLSLAQSNQKTLEEKRKKEIQMKKMAMLKLFEVNDQERFAFKDESPTCEAMRNAILLIGNPKADLKVREGKLTEFGKPLVSKFLQPLQNIQNTLVGKKPCARDGHSSIVFENSLIVFGGDRHQMSFNDIHTLDLTKI